MCSSHVFFIDDMQHNKWGRVSWWEIKYCNSRRGWSIYGLPQDGTQYQQEPQLACAWRLPLLPCMRRAPPETGYGVLIFLSNTIPYEPDSQHRHASVAYMIRNKHHFRVCSETIPYQRHVSFDFFCEKKQFYSFSCCGSSHTINTSLINARKLSNMPVIGTRYTLFVCGDLFGVLVTSTCQNIAWTAPLFTHAADLSTH